MGLANIKVSTFAGRKGKTLTCEGCRHPIEKGTRYQWFKVGFRSRHVHAYHATCRISDAARASGKMATVYSAVEGLREGIYSLPFESGDDAADLISSIESALETAADEWRSVGDEYREAAEASPTGYVFGVDYNETADTFDSAADSLINWSPDETEPDYDACEEEHHADDAEEGVERGSTDCEECMGIANDWVMSIRESVESHVDDAMGEIEIG